MSIEKKSLYAPLPSTTRSVPVHLSYDAKSDKLVYPSGKSIFIRPVDPSKLLDLIQFVQHNSPTTVARFAPSGFYIASGDEAGNVKIWDCVGEDLIVKGEYQVISGRINDLAWDADSRRIIAVGNGKERYGHCFTWDSGNTIGEISGHSLQINAVTIKPNRPYRAVTASDDAGVVLLQGPPFKFTNSVRGHHTNYVKDVAYSPDGAHFVSVGVDRKIVIYDGKSGEFLREIASDHKGGIYGLSWDLTNPKQFVTCSADATVKLYDIDSDSVVSTWKVAEAPSVEDQQLGVVFTKDYVVSLSLNGNLNYFDLSSPTPVHVVQGHQKSITSIASVGSGDVFSGSYDGRVVKWHEGIAKDVQGDKHGNLVVSISGASDDSVFTTAWDDTFKKIQGSEFVSSAAIGAQPTLMLSFAGQSVVLTADNRLVVYGDDGQTTNEIKVDFDITSLVLLSLKYLAVGAVQGNKIHIYDVSSWKESTITLPPLQSKPNVAAISPDETYLAVGDVMGKIVLYNLTTSSVQTSRWSFHTAKINSLLWNADNDHVVSASLDTNVIVYSVSRPGKNIKFLNAHKDGVNAVSWIAADEFVSGGNDGALKTWKTTFA